MPKKFNITDRIKSFGFAINGLKLMIKEEHNARIHLVAAIIAVLLSCFLKISALEWIIIAAGIALVFITELINSAIEKMADFVHPEKNQQIAEVKDMAAAAVLVAAVLSLIAAGIIFIPKLKVFF